MVAVALLAVLFAASSYCMLAILAPAQNFDFAITPNGPWIFSVTQKESKTTGNASDLYAPWLASREFLLHSQDPYSEKVAKEIQSAVYGGRVLRTHGTRNDEQRFAYPLYTSLIISPLLAIPFYWLQPLATVMFSFLTLVGFFYWKRGLRICLAPGKENFFAGLLLVCLPAVQGVWLQQLGLFVCFLLAAAFCAITAERLIVGGLLLAFAMMKPQLGLPMAFCLAFWLFGDFRRRHRAAVSFFAVLAVLISTAEILHPGWIPEWLHALREYRDYTQVRSFVEIVIGNPFAALAITTALWLLAACICFMLRRAEAGTTSFAAGLCLCVTTGLLTSPNWQLHNQVVLLPAGIWLVSVMKRFRGMQRLLPMAPIALLLASVLSMIGLLGAHAADWGGSAIASARLWQLRQF